MQTYIFYYNEAYEYLHMIDTIKDRFKYKKFHYEQKQIVQLTKHDFQYAIEICIPTIIYNNLVEYYKYNQNVKFETQEYTHTGGKIRSKLKYQKHINTDICTYDNMKLYEMSRVKRNNKSMILFAEHPKKHTHISKKTYDDLYNVLNPK